MLRLVIIDSDRDFSERVVEEARFAGDVDVLAVLHDDEHALATVKRTGAHIALVRVASPSINGLEVIRRLHSETPHVKIFVSALPAEEKLLPKAVEMGAHYCIIRPFDIPTLLRRMRQFVAPGPAVLAADQEMQQRHVATLIAQWLDALGVPRHFKEIGRAHV